MSRIPTEWPDFEELVRHSTSLSDAAGGKQDELQVLKTYPGVKEVPMSEL